MPEPKISEELKNMRREPLLPIEKKLIGGSLLLGLLLLGLLLWVSGALFRGGGGKAWVSVPACRLSNSSHRVRFE